MIELISSISIFGLTLSMIGTATLVKPFIMSNKAIMKLGAYKHSGAVLGKGTETLYNKELIKNFQEARDKSFEGISYIFVGFSLQLIQYIPLNEWYYILGR